MGIGASIFLIVVGAILAFAVHVSAAGLDLRVVGWILMLAGVAGMALFFVVRSRRRVRRTVVSEHRVPPTVVSERRVYGDTTQPPL